jgi:hypothetical protein
VPKLLITATRWMLMTSVVKCMSYTAHPFLYLRYDLSAQLRDSKGLESLVRKLKGLESLVRKLKLPDLFIAYLLKKANNP